MNDGLKTAVRLLSEKGLGIKQIATQREVGVERDLRRLRNKIQMVI